MNIDYSARLSSLPLNGTELMWTGLVDQQKWIVQQQRYQECLVL